MRAAYLFGLVFFVAVVLGCVLWKEHSGSQVYATRTIQSNLEAIVASQEADTKNFVDQLMIYSNPFDIQSDRRFSKLVFFDGRLIYWSDTKPLPKPEYSADSLSFFTSEGGTYLINHKSLKESDGRVEIFSYYPLYENPPIYNEFLSSRYSEEVFENYQVRLGGRGELALPTGGRMGFVLLNHRTPLTDTLVAVGSVGVFVFLFLLLRLPGRRFGWLYTVLFLILCRGLMFLITPYFSDFSAFNPAFYTSGPVNHTLGDLILNGIFLLLLLRILSSRIKLKITPVIQVIISGIGFYAAGYFFYKRVWDILNHSQMIMDVSRDISIDPMRILAMVAVLVYGALFIYLFSWFYQVFYKAAVHLFVKVGVSLGLGLLCYLLIPVKTLAIFPLIALSKWIIYLSRVRFDQRQLNYRSLIFSLILFACLSGIYSVSIYKHFEKKSLIEKEKFANWILIENDILGEYYLDQAMKEVKEDAFIRSRFYNPIFPRQSILDKIKGEYLSSYFEKYDIKGFFFDKEGIPLGPYDSLIARGLGAVEKAFMRPDFRTDYPDIYFIREVSDRKTAQYVAFIPLSSFQTRLGTIVLQLSLKKYIPRNVFPRLLVESRFSLSQENGFEYAMYDKGKLLYKQGKYEFENRLDYEDLINPKLLVVGIEKEGYSIYGIKTSKQQLLVIVSPTYQNLGLIANFSILFLLFFFIFSAWFLSYRWVIHSRRSTLSYKIQSYLGLSFILPMLIATVAILNSLNTSYKEEIDASFQQKAYGIQSFITQIFEEYLRNDLNKDEFTSQVNMASELVQADINIYNQEGALVATSESEVFDEKLASRQLDPGAYNAIKFGGKENAIFKQRIGKLGYKVSFSGIRSSENGRLIGFFTMPYFESKSHLGDQQREIFNNLISIFTLILLIMIVGGNLVISRIISPLKMITGKLQSMKLEALNTPISYVSDDEIGSLVQEYNSMIEKLEASKAALAESQKASAWQEIARQVAHEIKNPLTPMRLKIQQMRRLKNTTDPDVSVLDSLLSQVDALSSIADSFSEFAKMPAPKNERVHLNKLIQESCGLYQTSEVILDFKLTRKELYAFIDPKVLSGVLTNVILNGIQSTARPDIRITISLTQKGKSALIAVKDNGSGISPEDQENVFKPYFSTKSSGTGIGLAIAKKGIENAGGNIWFESEMGKGTTFFISLPALE